MLEKLYDKFKELFGYEAESKFFSPGRVNLIGEHTDYNGGHVFPCAIHKGTYALVKKRDDKKFRMYSENFENLGIIEFLLDNLVNEKKHKWVNYPKGVVKMFIEAGHKIDSGFDVLFYGNIPNGSGLSSSASIEIVTSIILKDLYNLDIDMVEMVKLSQKAENQFIGVNSGIMDQFAVGMGKKEVLVIGNTNKKRGLADSKYNERRAECEEALKDLQKELDIQSLGELSVEEFNKSEKLIKNEINRKRAKHAVYENQRTIKAQKELMEGNLKEFGRLMNESHVSLRDNYEVTGIELDTMVEITWNQEGVIGSRMTGAGFGGCTISIVKKNAVDKFIANVGKEYKERVGLNADFYVVNISDGAKKL